MSVETREIVRPQPEAVEMLRQFGAAKLSSVLARLGIRNSHMLGPVPQQRGVCIAGPAVTLQFMPKREDIEDGGEYSDPETQLHRHVLYSAQAGDVVVVDVRGDMRTGVFGEMMLTYLQGKGGLGVVIDGCLRDRGNCDNITMGIWTRGFTPNFHTQTDVMPHAVNVPIACGGVYVVPGDVVVADDDGAILVPIGMIDQVIERARKHKDWEPFSKERLMAGGDLRRYYPLADDARPEYEAWKRARGMAGS